MSPAAFSVLAFAIFMAGESLLLMIAPNFLMGIIGLPPVQEPFVRIVGLALMVFAYYYTRAALANLKTFFEFTVTGRMLQFVLFVGLFLAGLVPAILLGLSAVELASGVWTWFALKRS
jgi:hypothetical protein